MKHIYYLRHGESEMNVREVFAGTTNTPLTPKGRAQAAEAGKAAREAGLVFDVVVSSPLSRAHDTAKIFVSELGLDPEQIVIDELFIEREFGELEGKTAKNFTKQEYYYDPFLIDHYEGVERITDLHMRANLALKKLLDSEHNIILVVGHGGFGRSFRRAAENKTIHEPIEVFDNAVLYKLL